MSVQVATVPVEDSVVYGRLFLIDDKTGEARGNMPHTVILDKSPFTVGRYPDSQCYLDSPCISGRHCIFSRREAADPATGATGAAVAAGWEVVMGDLSTNACYVNGAKVGRGKSVVLRDNDEIALVIAARPEHAKYNLAVRFRSVAPPTPEQKQETAAAAAAAALYGASADDHHRAPKMKLAEIAATAKKMGHLAVATPAASPGRDGAVGYTPAPMETAPQRESQLLAAAADVNQSDIESDDDGGSSATGGLGGDDSRSFARTASIKTRDISSAYDLDTESPLGSGSFATVYRGVHRRTGKVVAVKQINKKRFLLHNGCDDEDDVKAATGGKAAPTPEEIAVARKKHEKDVLRHRREVEILLAVRHPHVVRCYGVYETEDRLWFVLSYAAGGELFQMLKSFGSVPESLARRIVSQLVAAVQYLHSVGVVHRDIKLENLLLYKPIGDMPTDSASADYRDWLDSVHVQVSDFGLSRTVGADRHLMSTMCGTPVYVAPEVTDVSLRIDGRTKGYTPAVDLFSVGVVAYALLTGRPPYPYAKDARTGQRVKNRVDYQAKIQWPAGGAYPPVSPEGRHCVEALLAIRPEARLSASGCLFHPWVLGTGTLATMTHGGPVVGGKRGRGPGGAADDDATP